MTNAEIITLFQTLVSDEGLDTTTMYQLLNQADGVIRSARPWEILKKLDSSKTRSSGDSYTTSKALPSDFHRPYKVFVGTGQPPIKRIQYEKQHQYKDSAGLYYIDFANALLYITNGTWTGTIYDYYIYKPLKLAATADSTHLDTPVFPEDYHPIYAYKMAEIFMGGIDEDERSVQAVPQWVKQYKELWDAMINWDAELKENDLVQLPYQDDNIPVVDLGRLGTP